MTLKELVKVLPAFTMVHVHNKKGRDRAFACQGNPHEFVSGLYNSHCDDIVLIISPISPYHIEVIVKEANNNAPMA